MFRNKFSKNITFFVLVVISILAWVYLWIDASKMNSMSGMNKMNSSPWSIEIIFSNFLMWSIMMVAMMIPSAIPAISLYESMVKKNAEREIFLPAVWIFVLGYILIWTAFSLVITVIQALFLSLDWINMMLVSKSIFLTSAILIMAGIYQWLPIKSICLEKCRTPLNFFLGNWKKGNSGALLMGIEHGSFCLGCCWVLMFMLFLAGVMNLIWVALITVFVFIEKVFPKGNLIGKTAGIIMIVAGLVQLI